MINFPLEVGILGWVSTALFWVVVVLVVWKIAEQIMRK